MSNFIYNSYSVEHPGVVHFYQADEQRLAGLQAARRERYEPAPQPLLSYLIAGAAVLVVVFAALFESAGSWSNGLLLSAWMVLWAIAFAGVALLYAPVRRTLKMMRYGYRAWVQSRQQAAADDRIWNAALQDARLMADLARAMDRQRR
ncbi:hypothetical protein GCM10010975_34090 [Comamonas phosphati]|nr:hypothetical protein GCM10010975_34090 [Comamonas phosphati]